MPNSLFDRGGRLQSNVLCDEITCIPKYKIEPTLRCWSRLTSVNSRRSIKKAQSFGQRHGWIFDAGNQVVLPMMNVGWAAILMLILILSACKKEPSSPISSTDERIRNPQILNLGEVKPNSDVTHRNSLEVMGKMESASKNGSNWANDTASRTSSDSDEDNRVANRGVESTSHQGSQGERSDSLSTNDSKPDGSKSEYRVLILGDSLAATGFGVILEKRLDVHPRIRCVRKAKSASGLARPDFFDWIGESKRQVRLQSPDLVVVIIGGNDGQDLLEKRGGKSRVSWKSQDWNKNYQERIVELLQPAVDAGAKILWLGLPRTDTKNFEAKLEIIRRSQREVIDNMGDIATYLDTTPLISGDDGLLLKSVKQGERKRELRVDDGIHFTMAGSQYFADRVYPEVLKILGLELSP